MDVSNPSILAAIMSLCLAHRALIASADNANSANCDPRFFAPVAKASQTYALTERHRPGRQQDYSSHRDHFADCIVHRCQIH